MRSKRMKRIALILAVTLAVQSAMGLKMFDMTVKADSSVSREEPAGENETTTGEISTEEESTGDGEGEETTTEEVTTEEPTTEEPTTEEPTTEEPTTEQPTTQPPVSGDYSIINGVYKVKDGTLIEYLGNKKDKTVTSLQIPAEIETIQARVFEDCKYIKKITFASKSKLTKIEKYAFKNCADLESITLPTSLEYIGYRAFGQCTSLEEFKVPGYVTFANQIFGTKNSVKKVTFGTKMRTIPEKILRNAESVTSISLPSKLKSIGKRAFYNCTSLKKVVLPSTVTVLNTSAFYNCSAMTKFTMSKNVTAIGMYVFKNCSSLKSMTLYKNIKSIGDGAFTGCKALTLKVYANSKGKAYARAKKINWDYTNSEKKRRAANQQIYDSYMSKITKKDKSKYQLKYLKNFVPQGTCILGKYVIVSMYHKHMSKRSILLVYDKNSGAFVKKIILPYYDHVGGVSNVKGRLVVSLNNISTYDYLAVYNYKKIKKAKHAKVLKPSYRVRVSGSADFSTYDGTYFWAGRSANVTSATMQGYKVKVKKKKLVFQSKKSYYIPANMQGLVVQKLTKTKRKFIFSQSYGRLNNSAIITYTKRINKSGGLGNPKKTLTLPSMIEGIAFKNNRYYMVFESAAGLYCGNPDNTSEIQIKNVCRIYSKKLGV